MNTPTLGIIGGGQLGSLLADAAKKIDIQTVILSDDPDAPGKHFASKFIFGQYDDDTTINNFINAVDLVTYEFENIPFAILKKINENKKVLPKPETSKTLVINNPHLKKALSYLGQSLSSSTDPSGGVFYPDYFGKNFIFEFYILKL